MWIYVTVSIFILFDILTGVCKGIYLGELNSTKLRQGLFHKLSEVIAVVGSGLLEYGIIYINLNIDFPILKVVVTYICVTELISILENLCVLNPSLAKLFKPYLEKLKEKGDSENE